MAGLFRDRQRAERSFGWQVVGVEVAERTAAGARSHGVDVVVSTFESWNLHRSSSFGSTR